MSGFKDEGRPFRPAEPESRAVVFSDDQGQVIRLPNELRFEETHVAVRKEGDRVILEPVRRFAPMSPEERMAFWARLDAMCDEPFPFPETERLQWREFDLDS